MPVTETKKSQNKKSDGSKKEPKEQPPPETKIGWGPSGIRPEIQPPPKGYPEVGARVCIFDCKHTEAYVDLSIIRPQGMSLLDKGKSWVAIDSTEISSYADSAKSGDKILTEKRKGLERELESAVGLTEKRFDPDGSGRYSVHYSEEVEAEIRKLGSKKLSKLVGNFSTEVNERSPYYGKPLSIDTDSPPKEIRKGDLMYKVGQFLIDLHSEETSFPPRDEFEKKFKSLIQLDYDESISMKEFRTATKIYKGKSPMERRKEGIKKPEAPNKPEMMDMIPNKLREAINFVSSTLRKDYPDHVITKAMVDQGKGRETIIPSVGRPPQEAKALKDLDANDIKMELNSLITSGETRAKIGKVSETFAADLIAKLNQKPVEKIPLGDHKKALSDSGKSSTKEEEDPNDGLPDPEFSDDDEEDDEEDDDDEDEEDQDPDDEDDEEGIEHELPLKKILCMPQFLKGTKWKKGVDLEGIDTTFLRNTSMSCGDVAMKYDMFFGEMGLEMYPYEMNYPIYDARYFEPGQRYFIETPDQAQEVRKANNMYNQALMDRMEQWAQTDGAQFLQDEGYNKLRCIMMARLSIADSRCIPLQKMWEYDSSYETDILPFVKVPPGLPKVWK